MQKLEEKHANYCAIVLVNIPPEFKELLKFECMSYYRIVLHH